MRNSRAFVLVLVTLAVTVGLLTAAAAAPVPPQKRCYDASGEEIPCPNSNYQQTQFAERATSRVSGPAYTPVPATFTPTPTASPTATSTIAPAATQVPASGAVPVQPAQPAAAPMDPAREPSTLQILIPLAMLGFAGLVGLVVLILIIRWLSIRRSPPPG